MNKKRHNPYFNRWFSAILKAKKLQEENKIVTILILIDGFLQYNKLNFFKFSLYSHNPYFNRWFSAILKVKKNHNQWNSCHNPYFNRWFSAINVYKIYKNYIYHVTILILIDGFLQY